MAAFNVVRFRVIPGAEPQFIEAHERQACEPQAPPVVGAARSWLSQPRGTRAALHRR